MSHQLGKVSTTLFASFCPPWLKSTRKHPLGNNLEVPKFSLLATAAFVPKITGPAFPWRVILQCCPICPLRPSMAFPSFSALIKKYERNTSPQLWSMTIQYPIAPLSNLQVTTGQEKHPWIGRRMAQYAQCWCESADIDISIHKPTRTDSGYSNRNQASAQRVMFYMFSEIFNEYTHTNVFWTHNKIIQNRSLPVCAILFYSQGALYTRHLLGKAHRIWTSSSCPLPGPMRTWSKEVTKCGFVWKYRVYSCIFPMK